MSIAQYTSPSPTVDATLKTVNGKVDELLNIAKAYGVDAVEGMSGSGAITLDLHATGPIKNTDAMNFSGSGAIQNATLKSPSLTQPVNIRNVEPAIHPELAQPDQPQRLDRLNQRHRQSEYRQLPGASADVCLAADKLNVTELQKLMASAPAKKAEASWSLVPTADAAPAPPPKPSLLDEATGSGTISVGISDLRPHRDVEREVEREPQSRCHPIESAHRAGFRRTNQRQHHRRPAAASRPASPSTPSSTAPTPTSCSPPSANYQRHALRNAQRQREPDFLHAGLGRRDPDPERAVLLHPHQRQADQD